MSNCCQLHLVHNGCLTRTIGHPRHATYGFTLPVESSTPPVNHRTATHTSSNLILEYHSQSRMILLKNETRLILVRIYMLNIPNLRPN